MPLHGPRNAVGRAWNAARIRHLQYAARLMRRLPAAGVGALIVALAAGIFLQTAPATEAASSCTGWKSTVVPPLHINVLRTALGRVDTVPFRRYVEFVLAAEWGPSNPPEALAAGAVAIRQYAWYHAMAGHWRGGRYGGTCYDVRDTNVDQVYQPATKTPTAKHHAAVERSWSVTLRKHSRKDPSGRFFLTSYNGGSTSRACGSGVTGWKLWQRGAADCAAEGYSFEAILRTYYGPNLRVVTMGRHDLDGDGRDDIGVFVGGAGPDTTYPLVLPSQGDTLRTLSDEPLSFPLSGLLGQATADLTGDGTADLAVLMRTGSGVQIRVVPAAKSGFARAEVWWDSAAPDRGLSITEVQLVTADWDADGKADLGLVAPVPGAPGTARLYELRSDGAGLKSPEPAWEGAIDPRNATVYGGDYNGDGRGDLAAVEDNRGGDPTAADHERRPGLAFVVVPSRRDGEGFGPVAVWYVERALAGDAALPVEADVDGDGRDDIVLLVRNGETGLTVYLYRAGGGSFTRSMLARLAAGFPWAGLKAGAADLDGNGFEDVFVLSAAGSGTRFRALLSSATAVAATDWESDRDLDWSTASPF